VKGFLTIGSHATSSNHDRRFLIAALGVFAEPASAPGGEWIAMSEKKATFFPEKAAFARFTMLCV